MRDMDSTFQHPKRLMLLGFTPGLHPLPPGIFPCYNLVQSREKTTRVTHYAWYSHVAGNHRVGQDKLWGAIILLLAESGFNHQPFVERFCILWYVCVVLQDNVQVNVPVRWKRIGDCHRCNPAHEMGTQEAWELFRLHVNPFFCTF